MILYYISVSKHSIFPNHLSLMLRNHLVALMFCRSLVASLPILQAGHCWKVHNGSSIRVIGDRWIPNHPTNKVLHPNHDLLDEMVVLELINLEIHV